MIETLSSDQPLNYGSHLPALMACAAVCEGPVLEIGCGHFSTPCLHALCAALKLPLVTTELDDSWREQFEDFQTDNHRIIKQTPGVLAAHSWGKWGLVFIDDHPDLRIGHLNMFFDSARFLIFHDVNFPGFEEIPKWLEERGCYHRTYTRYGPYTLAVSKTHPIPEFQ